MGTILKQMDWYSALQNMIAKSTDPNGIEIASSSVYLPVRGTGLHERESVLLGLWT